MSIFHVMVSLFLIAEIKWSFLRKKETSLHLIENYPGSDSMIKRTWSWDECEFGGRAFVFVAIVIDCE